jgi:hypothetical protein
VRSLVSSSSTTTSVNVPPTSTPRLYDTCESPAYANCPHLW